MKVTDLVSHASIVEDVTDFRHDVYEGNIFFKRFEGEKVAVVQIKLFNEVKRVGVGVAVSDLNDEEHAISLDTMYFMEPHELEAFAKFCRLVEKEIYGKVVC